MTQEAGNEIANVENTGLERVMEPTTGSLQRLEAEAMAMDKAFRMAKSLSATEMVPEHFQQARHGESAAWNLAAAILYGAELGLSAVQSAQNIFVVKGKPAVYARTMAAQVRRAGYRIEEVEADDQHVIWRGERDGAWASTEWTMERAEAAGYTRNEKYRTNPQEMLRAKCIAEICRIQYQDVLLGMAYTVEELQLDSVSVQRVVKRESRGAAALREIVKAAETSEEEHPASENETDVVRATKAQVEKIRRLYAAQDVKDQAVLDETGMFLQREQPLTELATLTREEAVEVINMLQGKEAG